MEIAMISELEAKVNRAREIDQCIRKLEHDLAAIQQHFAIAGYKIGSHSYTLESLTCHDVRTAIVPLIESRIAELSAELKAL